MSPYRNPYKPPWVHLMQSARAVVQLSSQPTSSVYEKFCTFKRCNNNLLFGGAGRVKVLLLPLRVIFRGTEDDQHSIESQVATKWSASQVKGLG